MKALRGALVALEHGKISAYGRRVFEAYFGEDRDISQDAVPRTVVGEVGLDPAEFFDRIGQAPYKDRVRANTDECIRRGGFGSPTLFVGESMFFGNDRLVLVENELRTRSRG